MNKKSLVAIMTVMLGAVACGGGGSGGTAPIVPVVPVTPAPTVSLSIDQSKVTIGQSAKLTWSSTNATSCTASGSWTGAQTTSGTATQTPTAPGATTYTLTCTGVGGTANQSVALTVPIPVLKSSYENKIAAGAALGPQKMPAEVLGGNAVAFADFFQTGSYAMVTHSLEYDNTDPSTANKFGHIHFYKSVNNVWTDVTASILSDTTGCLHPRKAVIADLNGDGKPDVYFACHGFDAAPYPGEQPHVLLSQADGTYKNVTLPITCYCHGASAAELSKAGFADILVTDTSVSQTPFFLMNNGDGTFTADMTRLPPSLLNKPMYSAELINFGSGKYDAFLGGNENVASAGGPNRQTIFPNDGTNHFTSTTPVLLPTDSTYGFPLDINFIGGNIYLLRTVDNAANPLGFYGAVEVQKIVYPSLAAQTIYQHSGSYSNVTAGFNSTWVNWIIPYQGNIVSMSAAYGLSVPQ